MWKWPVLRMFWRNIWCHNPGDGSALIMKHCKNNIKLYHHENIKSQKVFIMEQRIEKAVTVQ
jgi:hypothetical protein